LLADAVVAPALLSKEDIKARGMSRLKIAEGLHRRAAAVAQNAETLKDALRADLDAIFDGKSTFHWPLQFPEVFWREGDDKSTFGGFDAIVGNPPFMGGQHITGNLGVPYREYLIESLARGVKGSADLVTYFYLRAFDLLKEGGCFGLIATNTIAQGDTREVGLDQICGAASPQKNNVILKEPQATEGSPTSTTESSGDPSGRGAPLRMTPHNAGTPQNAGTIYRANPSQKWPGKANLEVAIVHIRKGDWKSTFILGNETVSGITPFLTPPGAIVGNPYRLAANAGKSFQGSIVLGMGFVMTPQEAQALIEKDARNAKVLFPYLNGEDLNSRPDQSPSRWVINFKDWPLNRETAPADYSGPVAADFPDCLEIVERLVKPERARLMGRNTIGTKRAKNWWLYGGDAKNLYEVIADLPKVSVSCRVSKYVMHALIPGKQIFDVTVNVLADCSIIAFVINNSTIYDAWVRKYVSSLETRIRYTLADGFETFPFPPPEPAQAKVLSDIGAAYHELRSTICVRRELGLTKVYNLFHDPETEGDSVPVRNAAPPFDDIRQLRALHRQMDEAVAAAYGWSDLNLNHGFHTTPQGIRFTIDEAARREILDRLLQLNHDRYAAEVRDGLHDKKTKSKRKTPKPRAKKADTSEPQKTPVNQKVLFPSGQRELEM